MSTRESRCGFCKKSRKLVDRLIEGPSNNFICDECIELCHNPVSYTHLTLPTNREV